MDSKNMEFVEEVTPAFGATNLDSDFFDGSSFGRDSDDEDSKEFIRTTSGRTGTVVMTAEDENEIIGVLKFVDGTSKGSIEVRRSQSFKPCDFPVISSDAEDFESDIETDTDEDNSEDILDQIGDIPTVSTLGYRRNRGASWLKCDTMGKLFTQEDSENEPPNRMAMDAFGNFVAPGCGREDGYLEHIKMMQKRQPQTAENKREPQKSHRLFFEPSPNLALALLLPKLQQLAE